MPQETAKKTSRFSEVGLVLRTSWRLTKMAWAYYPWTTFGTILVSLFIALMPFASSGISAILVNNLIKVATTGAGFSHTLVLIAIAYVIIGFIPDIFFSFQSYFQKHNYIGLGEKFQLMVLQKRAAIDIQSYENPELQDLINKVEDRDVWPITNLLENQFTNIQNVVQVLVALAILITVSPLLCLAILIGILPKFAIQVSYGRDVWSIWDSDTQTRRRYADMKKHFSERTWLIELKLFQNVGYFFEQLKKLLGDFNVKQMGVEKSKLWWSLASTLFLGVIIGGATIWIISRVVGGMMEVGTMLFLLASIDRLQSALGGFFIATASQHQWSLYSDGILKFLDIKPALHRSQNPITLDPNKTPVIVFENVGFAYPSSDTTGQTVSKTILRNISLTLNPGEKFALVGENGAGKTTFVKLLCRIYDPTEGRILVDGHNLRDIDLESWNRMLGVLFQEYATYSMPVKEAIAIGRSDASFTMDDVVSAAQASESESFIMQWKNTYDQMLGVEFEGGIDPSKGQNQRLAIARLLHRKAGLMILDEPTASIDAEAEMKIFDRIESLTGDQTVVLISHKFSTVRKADRICVFKGGTVEELGSHEELIAADGLYASLFKMQAEDYK